MAPILGYWSIRGLAQQIRYLLEFAGVEYEEKQYDIGPPPTFIGTEWKSAKTTLGLQFPNLPYYIDGELKITESSAILRYLARKHNLAGNTEEDRIKIDVALGLMTDFARENVMLSFKDNFEEAQQTYIKGIGVPLQKLSDLLGAGDFIIGSQVSLPDFGMFELLERFELVSPGCLSSYPSLKAYHKRFSELPAIAKYINSPRFQKIKSRINPRMSKIGAGDCQ